MPTLPVGVPPAQLVGLTLRIASKLERFPAPLVRMLAPDCVGVQLDDDEPTPHGFTILLRTLSLHV